ncbi:E3 ubiquitin-protein ligase LRSAM1-like isoform X2 [Centruroides vittatus]|uniref:E3 ubiquitin-protein ligase LRSAM1-like isoform X2 n=1 Tax=Centruroides vittatus TaxID=120091 RepID=UPI00350F031F
MGVIMSSNTNTTVEMPFFRSHSSSSNDRSKLEHKMCIAKETPEPIFDLAECNLSEIPSGVFSMCRVFRKEVLSLHNNKLTSLHDGGSLQDLSGLKVFDLHVNKIHKLPEDIGVLSSLQVLNLENNKLKKLPQSIQQLKYLQILNIKGNKFTEFPFMLCKLPRLRSLDIRNNKVTTLPKEFSMVETLQTIHLDAENFQYPSPEICKEGTESIMRFLCAENDKEYVPPSETDKLDLEMPVENADRSEVDLPERRRLELLQMEEEMYNNQESQTQIAANTQLRRQKLLENVVEEQEKLHDEILQLQSKKDKEKQNLLSILYNLEDHSAKLIDELMAVSEKSKNTEALLELMERDRKENEELFSLKQEELESLRKKEVLNAMKDMLEAEEKQRQYEANRLEIKKQLHKGSMNDDDERIHSILSGREQDQMAMINELLEEEQYQKQAFEALQLQRDLKHIELTHHIKQIQKELTKLTTAELKKKDLKINFELNVLAERRSKLAELLSCLMEQREMREAELKDRIHQMDLQREQEMNDFWLIQYQKLMDRKPQHIEELERMLDPAIQSILIDAEAEDYVTLFAAKHITLDNLLSMTKKELKKLGVLQDNACDKILKSANNYFKKNIEPNEEKISTEILPNDVPMPSAPPASPDEEERVVPSAPILTPTAEIKIWYQVECVVCLEKESRAVFLPCGHVCCCWSCGETLQTCPMCRADIENKFLNVA